MASASSWSGAPSIKGSTETLRMMLLTFSLIGLTITWGLEITYCTPYLLHLGLSKSKTSLVWIAGPLSGVIAVPVVGAITDKSTSKWGRRRPFMVWGSVTVSIALLLLGWTEEIVGFFTREETLKKNITLGTAVVSIYVLDFAVNAVGACSRSLIVDTLPITQQQAGSAWASRMMAAGHIIGYLLGSLDMVRVLGPRFGESQFKIMICIAIVSLLSAIGVTSFAVSERRLMPSDLTNGKTAFAVLPELFRRTLNLPPRMQAICWIQFWSWIGWFPFLIYSSTWVGEIYYRYEHHPTDSASDSHDALGKVGRLGSLSLVIMSLIQFIASVILPVAVESPEQGQTKSGSTPRPPRGLPQMPERALVKVHKLRPNMVTTWMIGEILFAAIMVCAPLVRSLTFAMTIIAAAGVPWSISCWAPFTEMGVEINNMTGGVTESTTLSDDGGYKAVRSEDALDVDDTELEMKDLPRRNHSTTGLLRRDSAPTEHEAGSTGELAGIYLGVLNVYTTFPQFISTFIAWVVFSSLEQGKAGVSDGDAEHHKWLDVKKDAPNAIAVCLFIGACCAMVSAEATRRLRRRDKAAEEGLVQ